MNLSRNLFQVILVLKDSQAVVWNVEIFVREVNNFETPLSTLLQ